MLCDAMWFMSGIETLFCILVAQTGNTHNVCVSPYCVCNQLAKFHCSFSSWTHTVIMSESFLGISNLSTVAYLVLVCLPVVILELIFRGAQHAGCCMAI